MKSAVTHNSLESFFYLYFCILGYYADEQQVAMFFYKDYFHDVVHSGIVLRARRKRDDQVSVEQKSIFGMEIMKNE